MNIHVSYNELETYGHQFGISFVDSVDDEWKPEVN